MSLYLWFDTESGEIEKYNFKNKDELINFLIDEIRSYEGWNNVRWGKKNSWYYLIPEGNDLYKER